MNELWPFKKSVDKIGNSYDSTPLSVRIVRDPTLQKMEAALTLWIEDRNNKRIPLGDAITVSKLNIFMHISKTIK